MKQVLKNKISNFTDEQLMESLTHNATDQEIKDWRNWGNNELRIMAEEAHKRELIA